MPTPDLLLHPVRLRIVQTLLDQPLTTLALVEALGDVPQATVYRHVSALADGGVLRVAEERPVQGGVERTYEVVEDAAGLGQADLEGADAATHIEWFTTFVGTMLAGFARAVDGAEEAAGGGAGPDLAAAGVGYHVVGLWLDDEELDELLAGIRDLLQQARQHRPGGRRRRRLLHTVTLPG